MRNRIHRYLLLFFTFFLLTHTHGQTQRLGKITNAILSEVSGITESAYQEGYFWVHNDSGDKGQIYLIDSLAKLKVTLKLEGLNLIDCEDIAKVIIDHKSYLLLADIGNNRQNRELLTIYMIPEPKVDFDNTVLQVEAKNIRKIVFKYADKKRDAEAIFVDQQHKELYIVSKRDFESTVFSFPLSAVESSAVLTLQPKLYLPFTFTTGADMRLDGRYIVIKNLTSVYMWERSLDEPVLTTLSRSYYEIPYKIEPQGEAICFATKRRYFYTISERPLGLDSYLYQYMY